MKGERKRKGGGTGVLEGGRKPGVKEKEEEEGRESECRRGGSAKEEEQV